LPLDTAQDFELSKQRLLETVSLLRQECGAQRIVIIGHSLGGLVAFHALSDQPMADVVDIVTVDSPLGGAPESEIQACIEYGLCAEGPVGGVLAGLHRDWGQTAVDNARRVGRLLEAGTRVTAWGNKSDCLYALSVCVPFARALFGGFDVRDTQWLGVDRTMQRDYVPRTSLASIINSHLVVLTNAATEIAADLFA
jgi:pimeloyl-ACP methyl ester carboxylesterase